MESVVANCSEACEARRDPPLTANEIALKLSDDVVLFLKRADERHVVSMADAERRLAFARSVLASGDCFSVTDTDSDTD